MISLFIPVYNGEKYIENNVSLVCNKLEEIADSFEVFVVDDGSTDKTQEICKNIKWVRYIRYDKPTRRENLARSFHLSRGDIIAYIDADLSVDLIYMRQLFDELKDVDISIGSRYKCYVKRKFMRKIISKTYNAFIRFFYRSKVLDHQCGFKAFKRNIILNLVNELGYDHTLDRGWFWDAEMLIKAQRYNNKIKEFPIKWTISDNSSFNFRKELRIIRYILREKCRKQKKTRLENI